MLTAYTCCSYYNVFLATLTSMQHAHQCVCCSLLQNEAILLIHFSSRYKRSEIINALNMNLPPSLRAKCVPFLNGYAD